MLDAWRWCLMTLALMALSLGWVGAQAWWSHLQTARASADSALAFIEARLAEIDEPMRRLQGADELQSAALDCSPTLTARLLHESLSSLLIQRLLVRDAAGARACGPAGALVAPDLPIDPGVDLGSGALFKREILEGIERRVYAKFAVKNPTPVGNYWGPPNNDAEATRRAKGRLRQAKYRRSHKLVWTLKT